MASRSRLYVMRFTVTGKGRFPLDMLRYDSCFPATQGDVCNLTPRDRQPRTVTLEHRGANKDWKPTAARWQSLGYTVGAFPEVR